MRYSTESVQKVTTYSGKATHSSFYYLQCEMHNVLLLLLLDSFIIIFVANDQLPAPIIEFIFVKAICN